MRDYSERIRKLLALAADQAGTPEGEAAARIARRLMIARARQMDGLSPADRQARDPYVRAPLAIGGGESWRRRLAAAVARHCECRLAWSWANREAALYGPRSGTEIAEFLYTVLARRVDGARAAFSARLEAPDDQRARREGGFCHSAVLALEGRLEALRRQEDTRDPEGGALVVSARHRLEEWLREQGIPFRPPPSAPHAFSQDGYLFGHRVPIQDGVTRGDDSDQIPERANGC